MAANNPHCPLFHLVMNQLENKMNLARVREIENHIKSSPCFHPPLKDLVLHGTGDVSTTLDGSTPLILACEQGDVESVQHIVEVWGVDIQAAATYYHSYPITGRLPFGKVTRGKKVVKKIRGATPIFVAVLKRHVDVVRYLISKGADLSATTSTEGNSKYAGITPLQVALESQSTTDSDSEDWRLEKSDIVDLLLKSGANPSTLSPDGEPMWRYGSVYSVIELINHDIDLNLRDSRGDTILHDWISWASLDLDIIDKEKFFVDGVQLLIKRGINLMSRDQQGFTPVLKTAELDTLVVNGLESIIPTLLSILDLLLEEEEIDAAEKIDAMELAGVKLLFELEDEKAFCYLRRALLLRDLSHHPKIPLQMTSAGRDEWTNSEQLEKVIGNPTIWWIQSKVAMLRIYADRSFEAVSYTRLFESGAHDFRSSPVEKAPTVTQILDFLLESLGVLRRFDPKLERHRELWEYKKKIIQELISKLPDSSTLGNDMALLNVECERIKTSLLLVRKLIFVVDPDGDFTRLKDSSAAFPSLQLRYKFLAALAGVPDVILHEDIWNFLSESVRPEFYKWHPSDKGILLAEACAKKDWKTLRLVLHLQVDPNDATRGSGGNGPLHLIADQQASLESEDILGNLLFDYGADPYRKNAQGKTAVDIWIERNCGVEGMESPKWKNRPYWCRNTVPKLSSLTAKTIHIHRIPYTRPGDLPIKLLHFLEKH